MKNYLLYANTDRLESLGANDIYTVQTDSPTGPEEPYIPLKSASLTKKQCASLIPHGNYCYDNNGSCPFLDRLPQFPKQDNGYCHYLNRGDWQSKGYGSLLWDACKSCGINQDEL